MTFEDIEEIKKRYQHILESDVGEGFSLDGKRLSKQEAFDYFVERDISCFASDQIRHLESHLALPKDKCMLPEGFRDWKELKSYYRKLNRWLACYYAGFAKKLPPLLDGVKVEHSGSIELYEPKIHKAARLGCGVIGMGWFAFLGISLLVCLLMKANGCINGWSSSTRTEYEECKSENPPW